MVDVPGSAAGGASVVGMAACAADEDPLQKRQLPGVARREARVAREQLLSERVLLLGDQRGHRDPLPVLGPDVLVGRPTGAPAPLPRQAGRLRRSAGDAPSAERRLPGVGGVAQDRPHGRLVPARLSGPRRDALLAQRPRDLDDRLAIFDVAAEDLPDGRRFELVDLVERVGVLGFLDIPVAVGRVGEHRDRACPRAVQLPAAAALGDLRALVLGDHPLELAQQLILRRARALGLLREYDLDPAARELFDQQHLVGVSTRKTVRRMTQHDLEAPIEGTVAKALQRRALQARAREPVILEDELLRDEQPPLLSELTQRDGLTRDRPLLALALRRDPRVDRRDPDLPPVGLRDLAAHHRSLRCLSPVAARATPPSTPAPAAHRRAGHRRTRSQRAWPPPRSPACARYARTASAVTALNV